MAELSDEIFARVEELSERGNSALEAEQAQAAIKFWSEALALLPAPQKQWDAAVWLHTSIGEAHRSEGRLSEALSHYESAYASADGYKNPYVLASLGVTLYDVGRRDDAADYLLRSYMLEGEDIFEEFGTQYLGYLREKKLIR